MKLDSKTPPQFCGLATQMKDCQKDDTTMLVGEFDISKNTGWFTGLLTMAWVVSRIPCKIK